MTIDTNTMVSISEANQNFSKVARLVDECGSAVILKNNVPRYLVIDFSKADKDMIASDDDVLSISKQLMEQNREAYEVLASSSVAIPPSHLDLFGRGFEVSMSNLFSMIVGVLCTQTYIQCIFSADTPITAAAGCITAALIVIPVGLPSVAVGMYMSAFDPNVVPVLTLPTYFTNHASFLVGGLAMGGIVLSLISSIGGLSLGIGTMLVTDILMPILHLQDDKALFRLTKISVLSVMAAACVIAAMNRGKPVLFWNYLSMGLRGGGIFLPLTLSVFFPGHLKRGWAVLSMAGSTVAAILAVVLHLPIDSLFAGLIVSVLLILPGLRLKRVDGE